ncbi:alanine racemase [Mesorhizobium sp. LHD-90]|uniref:alanine racemase n=1 Tax=Mesorhizobium sp. LHD-90 TaxID=3071414 RepID=UPI0027E0E19A|nr:alanine racemase [Mesorhizobium sp. LHD-90]MDQ6435509.1 alanine racemase [Mesorhizobium sp. LHD-90]
MNPALKIVTPTEVIATSPDNAPSLRVDLGAIRSNFLEMRRRYHGQILSAVVKSDAYGLGLEPVVRALAATGCKVFWVNDLEEAARVKSVAPEAAAHTLMGLANAHIRDFEALGVIPALTSLAEVEHCARHALLAGRRAAVAIQIDTGLGRLGLCEEELAFLAGEPDMLAHLDIRLWVSHLAAYNLPEDPENAEQRRRLREWVSRLPPAPISLAASSGVFMADDWHFDLARVGSALYGVQTSTVWQDGLTPCYELSAPVIRVADYPAGRHLGYRGTTELKRASRVATLSIGYANGLPQRFAEIGAVRFGGVSVPLIGGIAMNMTMADLTDVPAGTDIAATRAIFFDRGQPIEPVAERLDCAPNVLLTQIGAGTRRVYFNE